MTQTPFARTLARSAAVVALCAAAAACGGRTGEAARGEQQPGGARDAAKVAVADAPADAPLLVVHKSPTCGCCASWVEHMQASGFRVEVHDVPEAQLQATKRQNAVPQHLESCHTATVGGYALEGHVPADVVKRLLREKPAVAGIAVPGMPVGSPGMEMGDRKDPYDVVAFTRAGQTSVYASK